MAVVRAKLNELVPTLNQDELKNYAILMEKEEERENSFSYRLKHIFKKESKEEVTTGLARASIKKDIITKTGNVEFDKIFKEYVGLAKDIENVNDDYINKTKITKAEAKRIALEVMTEVGIPLPKQRFKQYPFEFSGGMRQRIVIAIALTANSDILICDEPTTALDVTIQAQILELINKLKRERGLSCIFITHDLGVVANMADRVAVMYAGKIVEYGTSLEIFFEPKHPYTWALLSSIPDIDSKERLESIAGTPPDMRFPPDGDAFALRSKYALAVDFKFEPPYFKISDTHYAATWFLYPGAPKVEMPRIVKTRIENALKGVK
ncbi:MAG: ABC transporter ATP-binding protein [Erysipelotrichaceae bacterium]|nr:ABC transporter ATP-binding protein [Erysipelotrichaceae bacterium]MCB9499996.1 ABC transporter ATP-binding protein [Erysipelotrichaceae bacterium]